MKEPLRTERIEAKPKRVNFFQFKDEAGASRDAGLLLDFNELQDCIANGWEVPDRFYRLDIGKNKDRLLDETGIKHLHLGGRGSDILVYLIELDDRVILLRISGHAYLEDEPRGFSIREALGLPEDWTWGIRKSDAA